MRYGMVVVGLLIPACGGDVTSTTYADVSGTFAGPISGTSQGSTLSATLTLTVVQNGASLSGTHRIAGTINGTAISGTTIFAGEVTSGSNPSVDVMTNVQNCPTVHATYSGSYDSANRRLTMTGPLDVLDADCSVILTFSLTLVLTK
jgi:hypothetical protein